MRRTATPRTDDEQTHVHLFARGGGRSALCGLRLACRNDEDHPHAARAVLDQRWCGSVKRRAVDRDRGGSSRPRCRPGRVRDRRSRSLDRAPDAIRVQRPRKRATSRRVSTPRPNRRGRGNGVGDRPPPLQRADVSRCQGPWPTITVGTGRAASRSDQAARHGVRDQSYRPAPAYPVAPADLQGPGDARVAPTPGTVPFGAANWICRGPTAYRTVECELGATRGQQRPVSILDSETCNEPIWALRDDRNTDSRRGSMETHVNPTPRRRTPPPDRRPTMAVLNPRTRTRRPGRLRDGRRSRWRLLASRGDAANDTLSGQRRKRRAAFDLLDCNAGMSRSRIRKPDTVNVPIRIQGDRFWLDALRPAACTA